MLAKFHLWPILTLMMKYVFITGLMLCVVACSSTKTSFNTLASGQYQMVGASSDGGEAVREVINKASDYCAKRHERLIVTNFNSNYQAVGTPKGRRDEADITFTCAQPLN